MTMYYIITGDGKPLVCFYGEQIARRYLTEIVKPYDDPARRWSSA